MVTMSNPPRRAYGMVTLVSCPIQEVQIGLATRRFRGLALDAAVVGLAALVGPSG